MSVPLSRATLGDIPDSIRRPGYKSSDLTPGIVHFGVGNFHRSHQACYLDRLFSKGLGRDWALIGAGVMPGDERMRDLLEKQDYLSLLVTRSADHDDARIIGPMVDFLPVGDEAAISAQLADPGIRIVSLTVTEGGYFLDPDGNFDSVHPAIQADAANPDQPQTVFGIMLKALKARYHAGHAPFTVMSCDNLPHNGALTRGTTLGLARLIDPELAEWVEYNVAFPNGMVDRITPATGERERRIAREEYGVDDALPVFSEDFIQWVLEDNFPQGRPPLEEVGVTFAVDVTPYEEMKLRILNGSHAMIAYPAALLGIEFAHDAMAHDLIGGMLDKIQQQEVIPGVQAVPEMDPADYFAIIRTRFANANIADTVDRLCYDGSNRQPKFILPSLRHAMANDLPIDGLALASALWCRYCAGTREDGSVIVANDPQWDRLNEAALAARDNPDAWLGMQDIYGSIGQSPQLHEAFARQLGSLWDKGVAVTLTAYIAA